MHDDIEPFDRSQAITLTDACRSMKGRSGRRLNLQVAQRYASRGIHVTGHRRLFLPSVKIGGVFWTMPSWVQWFEQTRAGLSGPPRTIQDESRPRTALQSTRSHLRAVKRLKKAGMM